MNVIVCVKQIPDPAMPGELNSSTNTLKREGKLILDESDSYGAGEGRPPGAAGPAVPGELNSATNPLKREGKLILDESDSYGVEMALQLVATAGEGEVSLVSMAPNGEVSGPRTALAR